MVGQLHGMINEEIWPTSILLHTVSEAEGLTKRRSYLLWKVKLNFYSEACGWMELMFSHLTEHGRFLPMVVRHLGNLMVSFACN